MKKSRYSDSQIMAIFKQADTVRMSPSYVVNME